MSFVKGCGKIVGCLIAAAILTTQYCGVVFGVILAVRGLWVNSALCFFIATIILLIRKRLAKMVGDDDE